jgi:hypothetical protein
MSKLSTPEPSPAVRRLPAEVAIAFFLALFLFGVYLLSFSGRITSSDGLAMFAVTESAVKRGDVSTDQMWTFFGTKSAPAPDGEVYSKYGYGTSLLAAPLYAIALYVPFFGLMSLTVLSSAIAVAVAGAFLYLAARRLRFSVAVAIATTLLFGLATPAWVYAKEFWSEPFALATLFAAFYFLLAYRAERGLPQAALAGIGLGLAIAIRTTNLLLLPLYVWYAFWMPSHTIGRQKKDEKKQKVDWRGVFWFVLPLLGFVAAIFFYNAMRFGNPLTTGYRADENFRNNIFLGAYGLLFSPGKGLLVYAPFLAALPFGIWQFYKRFRRELVFAVLLFTVYCLLFSTWYYWWGGTNWAARFLVPTLPFLVLLCAPFLELLFEPPPLVSRFALYALRFIFALLVAISFVNELAGVSVHSLTYRLALLKNFPNADWDSIFQPALSPLIGHWQIFKPTNLEFAWLRANADSVQVDWTALALTLGVILFALYMLARVLRGKELPRVATRINVALAIVLTLLVMARYADDPRLGGNDGYRKLLAVVQQQSTAQDVLLLNDDAHARYFFNTNRAPLKWYGLSRDPARWDAPTQQLVTRLGQEYARVWFAYDDAVDAPNPLRDWLEANWTQVQRVTFENGVTLETYAP